MSAIAVGEITIVDLHDEDVHIGTTAPAELKDGRLWLDTSTVPNVMKRWDAATQKWIKASPTEASDIGAETPSGAQDKADGAEDAAKTYAEQKAAAAEQAAKGYAEQKAQAARDAARNNLAYQLGYSSYTDMVAKARTAGKTIIAGGYLNTELLEANSIVASKIAVLPDNKIASASTWHAKETPSGAQAKADAAASAAQAAAKQYAEQQVDAVEVGGRNLITDSKERTIEAVNDWTYRAIYYGLARNTTYTISFEAEFLEGQSDYITVYPYLAIGQALSLIHIPYSAGIRMSATFTTDDRYDYNLIIYAGKSGETAGNTVKFKKLKLERGNKPTDWSPAPEDVEAHAEQQAADAKQDAQDYASQILKNLADGEYPDGTFITGKSIYTPEIYAGRMYGLRGTFHDLLAGNPEGSRIEMGEKLIGAQAKVSRPEYAIASGFEPGHEPSKAFDGDTGTYWERNVGDFVWIGQEFPEPVCVKAVRRYCASGPWGGDALLYCLIYYDESAGTWRNLDYLDSLYGEGWSQQNVNPGNVYAKKWACSFYPIPAVLNCYVYELEFYDERFSPFVDGYVTKTQKAFELNAAGIGTFDGFFFMDGYPAGVIIAQGGNSNGSWVQFSNGLQMCWGSNTFPGEGWTGSGDKWRLTGQSLTFPITFASAPTFLGATQDQHISGRSAKLAYFSAGTSSVSNIAFSGWGTTSSSFRLHWLAIGWWRELEES